MARIRAEFQNMTNSLSSKLDSIKAVQYTVPTTGWSNDGASGCYYYDVNVSGLTTNDVVNVNDRVEC